MMNAKDVFNIAKHLERNELMKLNSLIEKKLYNQNDKKSKMIYNEKEIIQYLIKTHFSKIKNSQDTSK